MSIQLKRGLSSARKISEVVLEDGQPFYEKDTKQIYVGDGQTKLKDLQASNSSNISSGTGKYALQQFITADTFPFAENNNSKAVELDTSLKGDITNGGTGEYSTSLGGKAAASGRKSFASGTNVIAKGQYSFVNGDNTVALGQSSHAEGSKTTASGIASHSEGTESWAGNLGSHAEGNKTEATGEFAHAEGNLSKSVGDVSHAEGYNTIAAGDSSHTEGNGSQTKSEKYIRPSSGGSSGGGGGGSGGGTSEPTQPDDDMSTFFGVGAHAEGAETIASGYVAHAEGYKTYASGHMSHAEGSVTDALGDYSHVEGVGSKAKGSISHAEGGGTTAEGKWSHSEGAGTLASGDASHAEGTNCQAIGNYSHAGGMSSTAKGDIAFAHGLHAVANAGQTVFGNYNAEDTDSIFIVGAGTQSLSQNAFKVASSGQVLFEQAPTNSQAPIRLSDFTDDFFVNSKAELAKRAIQANDFASEGTIKSNFDSHLQQIQNNSSQISNLLTTLKTTNSNLSGVANDVHNLRVWKDSIRTEIRIETLDMSKVYIAHDSSSGDYVLMCNGATYKPVSYTGQFTSGKVYKWNDINLINQSYSQLKISNIEATIMAHPTTHRYELVNFTYRIHRSLSKEYIYGSTDSWNIYNSEDYTYNGSSNSYTSITIKTSNISLPEYEKIATSVKHFVLQYTITTKADNLKDYVNHLPSKNITAIGYINNLYNLLV